MDTSRSSPVTWNVCGAFLHMHHEFKIVGGEIQGPKSLIWASLELDTLMSKQAAQIVYL